jgi:hypothetical protein
MSVAISRDYNAAVDLIERNLKAGRGAKIAYYDDRGAYSYGALAERVDRAANALPRFGPGAGAACALVPARRHRFPGNVPRRHQGRDRADCRQYLADRGRLRFHAAGQPRAHLSFPTRSTIASRRF